MLDLNKTLDQALTLTCRMAKEKVFSLNAHKARIDFLPQFPSSLLTMDQVGKLASEMPIGPVLKQYAGIPANVADSMGRKSWTDLFREFIQECRVKMEAENINISRIIHYRLALPRCRSCGKPCRESMPSWVTTAS